jgi:hypothetical protein
LKKKEKKEVPKTFRRKTIIEIAKEGQFISS